MKKTRASYKRQIKINRSMQNFCLLAILLVFVLSLYNLNQTKKKYIHPEIIDFSAIENLNLRKQTFIDFFAPKIKAQNKKIMIQRKKIRIAVTDKNINQLCAISLEAKLDCRGLKNQINRLGDELLKRINIIPVSLALAQGAIESGWGTSRFSLQGLNLFGIWCFSRGCGIVPTLRKEGKNYEIKSYSTIHQSIEDYFNLLNYGINFKKFREIRAKLENINAKSNIFPLTRGLKNYSGIENEKYIERVRKIILSERLIDYN